MPAVDSDAKGDPDMIDRNLSRLTGTIASTLVRATLLVPALVDKSMAQKVRNALIPA